MEFYLFILVVLFATAITDLTVGVANDAVNFLNSAIGSKVASRRTILLVASLGVFIGTTFSSGIMEVARKGIFNPEFFALHDVMAIFLAVMFTDILLLDIFNTYGLPTSTTVSIVFALLGGAMSVAVIKAFASGGSFAEALSFINTANVLTIVSSIGLSVLFAFFFGVLIQFITRYIFTFNYQKTFRRFGGAYSAAALVAITYFILVKGAKGSSLLTDEQANWMLTHLREILLGSFVFWFVILQSIIAFTRVNVLKLLVLTGMFALALAFAANDLVNFIGAPLAALGAYDIAAGSDNPLGISMAALRNPIRANNIILVFAGAVMVATLWISRKARTVTQTEVSLGRQEEGVERFESSMLSRGIVRMFISVFDFFKGMTPAPLQRSIRKRVNPEMYKPVPAADGELPAFDELRAAVNLIVASALISLGTSLKLPLSTTFVTFMVAMASSLADRSWGRESAVYRVNGVITVVGGWFFTAVMAFGTALVFAYVIYYGKLPAILGLIAFGILIFYQTSKVHKKRETSFDLRASALAANSTTKEGLDRIMQTVSTMLTVVAHTVDQAYEGLIKNKRKLLKQSRVAAMEITRDSDRILTDMFHFLRAASEEEIAGEPRYARNIAAIQIITANVNSLTASVFNHIDNNHSVPDDAQIAELKEVRKIVTTILTETAIAIENKLFSKSEQIGSAMTQLKDTIRKLNRNQMKRVKNGKCSTRQGLLFVGTVSKVERIAEQTALLLKLYEESIADAQKDGNPDCDIHVANTQASFST